VDRSSYSAGVRISGERDGSVDIVADVWIASASVIAVLGVSEGEYG
jgi:hypothetical protein